MSGPTTSHGEFQRELAQGVITRLVRLTVGTCSCGVKSPELTHHTESCNYRLAREALDIARPLLADPPSLSLIEAERDKADNALVDRYRDPKTGVFNFPTDVAAIVRRLDATEAERDKLRAALAGVVAVADRDTAEFSRARAALHPTDNDHGDGN